MEYKFRKVEQENHELMSSLKELQEAGIREAVNSSSSKLRNRLKGLEQAHRECSTHIKAKEAEWASKLESLTGDLYCCKSELKNKDASITKLQMDLTLQNEEASLMLLVMKSHLSELHKRIADIKAATEQSEKNSIAEKGVEDEHEKEAMPLIEEQKLPLQIEVDILKEMLKEASTHQSHLIEQLLKTKVDLKEAKNALDRTNEQLEDNFYQAKEIEFELQIWRSVAERLKSSLEENHQMRREVEASLFEQADVEYELRRDKDSLVQILAKKEEEIIELKEQIPLQSEEIKKRETRAFQATLEWFEEEWLRKELEKAILAQVEAEGKHKKEKENLNRRIDDLLQLVRSLELEFENSSSSFSTRLVEMLADCDMLYQTWETVKEAVVLKEIEIEEKNMINLELERQTSSSDDTIKKLMDERAKVLDMFVTISDKISQISMEDMHLSKKLGRITAGIDVDMKSANELFDPVKENQSPNPTKIVEAAAIVEERLPFRALNN